jgi:hypothetical protein
MLWNISIDQQLCAHCGKEDNLTWVVSEGSLHKVVSEDDRVLLRHLAMSGEADPVPGSFSVSNLVPEYRRCQRRVTTSVCRCCFISAYH